MKTMKTFRNSYTQFSKAVTGKGYEIYRSNSVNGAFKKIKR